jgi:hypothetical protein
VTKERDEAARRLMAAAIRARALLENWGSGQLTKTPAYADLCWAIESGEVADIEPIARPDSIEV